MQVRNRSQRILPSSSLLSDAAHSDIAHVFSRLHSTPAGLTEQEAAHRLARVGRNEIASERPLPWWLQFARTFTNPFVLVLVVLGLVSCLTDVLLAAPDARSWTKVVILTIMILLSCVLRFWQECRSQRAVSHLQAMVHTHATVQRHHPDASSSEHYELPIAQLVPGDLIHLSAGDMVPADVRLLTARDLFVNQSAFTGEAMPVEKMACELTPGEKGASERQSNLRASDPLALSSICLLGTSVVSGTASAVVVCTGTQTFLHTVGSSVLGQRPKTHFEHGVNQVTWVLIRFMLLMAPVVFLINGFSKGDWREAFFFTLAVAVGLTPELLPLIVTTNLVKGALQMARAQVIVKHLPAIQNLGAIDVLCTDKTGTLTENQVTLVHHLDAGGRPSARVLHLAYLNSAHQTGLKNLLDQAILDQAEQHHPAWRTVRPPYHKLDELPFDFVRRRMSVIVQQESEPPQLICKGALEEILQTCWGVEQQGEVIPLTEVVQARIERQGKLLQDEGLRVIALASKRLSYLHTRYTLEDEQDLVFAGFLGFLDPAKVSAKATLEALSQQGIAVKVLTGDHEGITAWICEEVGLDPSRLLLAHEIDGMDDEELAAIAEQTVVFARVNPLHKVRILQALKRNGHTVGYLGDGINDAAALREADVSVSVDTAVDIAKASADVILLHKDLQVLAQGILEGRKVFGNIIKYVKMAASSNFGNALSVLLASAFLPFLPMLSLQLLVQNLLYDVSQLALPWDHLDGEFLARPRQWDARSLARFMLCFGPLSSLFDLTTFAVLWFVFRANVPAAQSLFQSGWFVEGLLSQTLIVHLLRTQKIPFLQSRASLPVIFLTGSLMLVGLILPFTSAGRVIGLRALPWSYFPWLLMTLLTYCVLTQFVKTRYLRRFRSWL